jgi:glycosyltransferase involved in cell wall biosynthesis
MTRRRVLIVPKWYPWPDRPVWGLFTREHARVVAQTNDVAVLPSDAVRSPEFLAWKLTEEVEDGLRTLRLRYRRPLLRPASMALHVAGAVAALRRLRREGFEPDVVHAHVYSAALPALVIARMARAPLVVSEHYTGFQRGLVRGSDLRTARRAFHGADLLAPVSRELAERLRPLAGDTPIRVVANPVDTEVFHPAAGPRPEGPPRLLSVAWLDPKKGHRFLLDALAALARDDVTLDLVGGGELRPELEAQAARLGLVGRVRFLGPLAKEGVAELMRRADLLVLPSLHENLPVVLAEAMASGLPAVATRVGGVEELVDHDDIGTLVAPGDAGALADAIRHRLDAPRRDPGALAARAAERFGYEALGRTWDEIYEELSTSRRGSTSSRTTRASSSRR